MKKEKTYDKSMKEKQSLCSKRQNRLKKYATNAELVFKDKLDQLELKYQFQKGFIKGKNFCIVDFYLPRPHKICIEIDGGYHNDPEQIKRDINRTFYLEKQRGYKVIRFTNEEAEAFSLEQIKERLFYETK